MRVHAAIAGMGLIVLAGCGHAAQGKVRPDSAPGEYRTQAPSEGAPPPPWINNPPHDKSNFYSVGISGPTFYPDDAVRYACDNARVEMARTISSHITSAFLSVATNNGTYADSAAVVDATHDYSDTILENSEVVATWVDKAGAYSGNAGTAYALIKVDRSKLQPSASK